MNATPDILTTFTTRVRQLILLVSEQQRELSALRAAIADKDKRVAELEQQNGQLQQDSADIMAARMLTIADKDVEAARRRVDKLIRAVDKCIAVINAEEDEEKSINN